MAGDETSRLASSLETVPSLHSLPRMMPLQIPCPDADQIAKGFPSLSAFMTAIYERL